MMTRAARPALLAALAPLAVGAILLGSPAPAAQAAPSAQALPTDKDQCKDSGWRQWKDVAPFFKNQGDCVSFTNGSGGGGGAPGVPPVDPAATPELGSLALFGSGAAGFAGYALSRVRARRR